MARAYRRLTAADEDEIWKRLRTGHAAKPTARALGLSTSTVRAYLILWWDPAWSEVSVCGSFEFR